MQRPATALALLDENLNYLMVNQAFSDLTGHAIETHLQQHIAEIPTSSAQQLYPALLKLTAAGRGPVS